MSGGFSLNNTFPKFLNSYLDAWRNSSLTDLKDFISQDYKAREVTGGEIDDFGYKESILGWEQGFNFAREHNAEWKINVHATIPLREDETMVILSATLVIKEKHIETTNLFIQTFKKSEESWKLVRSYIEAGVRSNSSNIIFYN